jgi:PPOX class probable F420-dependent enzyme
MPSRRQQIAMTDEERALFLDEQRVINIATNGPTGHPHLVAMWYAVIDGDVTFWTFAKSQKVINLRRDPRISGLVEAGDEYDELRGVEVFGTAELVDGADAVLEVGTTIARRYNGDAVSSDIALEILRKQAEKRIGVRIKADGWVSWDHRKLGGTY